MLVSRGAKYSRNGWGNAAVLKRMIDGSSGGAAMIAALVVVATLAVHPGAVFANAAPSFFGSQETRSDNLKPFQKWNEAIERFTKEDKIKEGTCDAKQMTKCHYAQWMDFLGKLKDKDKLEQVNAVNAYMNRAKYITDDNNWGQSDYWASIGEFMAKFGDCEDYAIAKYLSLRKLGFTNDELRVVAVKDLNLKVGHAILVVILGGKSYVLDNQIKQVVEADRVKHYEPVFSINTEYWWRHRV